MHAARVGRRQSPHRAHPRGQSATAPGTERLSTETARLGKEKGNLTSQSRPARAGGRDVRLGSPRRSGWSQGGSGSERRDFHRLPKSD